MEGREHTLKDYDVIVIGAGFGGPVAAKKCADAGLKTLIVERSRNVGDKVISGLTIPFYGFLFGPAFIRDGNPPIERPVDGIINYIIKDIDSGDIEIDDSLKIPLPLSPIISFGYNAYCKRFCEWEVKKASESGAELLTSTTVVDFVRDKGHIKGVITDKGEQIPSKIIIDAEGSQGLLAIKAGVREKYPPEVISLADVHDYEMAKEDIDKILGYSIRFCWGWDEQRLMPPLGYGNGLMVWPYKNSLHFIQDQCLRIDQETVPNLKKLFEEYHRNITSKLPLWKEEIAPAARLRARMWEGFEIYVGLDEHVRQKPKSTDGMVLIGDAAGLENTELCDGVPTAWFSAEIAADVAIEAIQRNDTSKEFLKRYDDRIAAHPLIQWAISGRNRYNLRDAQKDHDLEKLRKYIHDGWGLGGFGSVSTPLLKMILVSIKEDPEIMTKWIRMYFRYYYNWLHERYDYSDDLSIPKRGQVQEASISQAAFRTGLDLMSALLSVFAPVNTGIADLLEPFTGIANPIMKRLLPAIEAGNNVLRKIEPIMKPLSQRLVDFVLQADPRIFDEPL